MGLELAASVLDASVESTPGQASVSNYELLFKHFTDPARKAALVGQRVIWLSDDNIRALSQDEEFMYGFRRRRGLL